MAKATVKRTPSRKTAAPAPLAALDITTRDAVGRTPLHLAAWYGYSTTVQRMLQQQAEVNARDEMARTPGHWAAFKGYLAVVKLLVDAGADVNARDAEGRTLLTMAAIGGQPVVEEYLRAHGGTA